MAMTPKRPPPRAPKRVTKTVSAVKGPKRAVAVGRTKPSSPARDAAYSQFQATRTASGGAPRPQMAAGAATTMGPKRPQMQTPPGGVAPRMARAAVGPAGPAMGAAPQLQRPSPMTPGFSKGGVVKKPPRR